jgi:hypothetical protein
MSDAQNATIAVLLKAHCSLLTSYFSRTYRPLGKIAANSWGGMTSS